MFTTKVFECDRRDRFGRQLKTVINLWKTKICHMVDDLFDAIVVVCHACYSDTGIATVRDAVA